MEIVTERCICNTSIGRRIIRASLRETKYYGPTLGIPASRERASPALVRRVLHLSLNAKVSLTPCLSYSSDFTPDMHTFPESLQPQGYTKRLSRYGAPRVHTTHSRAEHADAPEQLSAKRYPVSDGK